MAVYRLNECGIYPDPQRVQTRELQALIDRCGKENGGTIVFPPGTYVTGTLTLCDNLTLELEKGAMLAGSTSDADYPLHTPSPIPFFEGRNGIRALLLAMGLKNLKLRGRGIINGRSDQFTGECFRTTRPRVIWFGNCKNIEVSDLIMLNANYWMQHYIQCKNIRLSGLTIRNHGCQNNDGIDIDSCSDVEISHCIIDSSDDAICLKCCTEQPCTDVYVHDCITSSEHANFKLGTETLGGFRHIRAENLTMIPSSELKHKYQGNWPGYVGVAIAAMDGAFLEDVEVRNVTACGMKMPLLLRLGDRRRGLLGEENAGGPPKYYRNVTICNLHAVNADPRGCFICGLKDHPMENITLEDIYIEFGGTPHPEWKEVFVPEAEKISPCTTTFGDNGLPAFLYCRDIIGLKMNRVEIFKPCGDDRPDWLQVRCRN